MPSFPKELTDKLQELTGVPGFLGNCHASGTTIINELGDEHVATGKPILYTSADSVLQIAAHEEHFGLERLYDVCEAAYELVKPYNIGRVIARPFLGANGNYKRTAQPPRLRRAADRADPARPREERRRRSHRAGQDQRHLRRARRDAAWSRAPTTWRCSTAAGRWPTKRGDKSLTFVNFVDFDMHFGHRRDVAGYSNALHELDARLPEFIAKLKDGDLVVITADHGCDPTAPAPTTPANTSR